MTAKPFEFEQSLKELEAITLWFESSDVDLDQGLVKFERGMELAAQLKNHLATVENRVEKIKQRFTATPQAATSADEPDPAPDSSPDPTPGDEQTGIFG